MKSLFLDTNIFLHFTSYDQIDWTKIIDSDDFEIVICPIVITELDQKKYLSGTSKRAKKALSKIESDNQLVIISRRPNQSTFESHHLSTQNNDDHLIASILEFKEENKSKEPVLITHDTGPRLSAKSLNIHTLDLPDQYKLKIEDSQQKKIDEQRKELNKLRNRLPKLNVSFKSGNESIAFQIKEIIQDPEKIIEAEITKLKDKYPKINSQSERKKQEIDVKFNLRSAISLTQEQIDKYINELDTFFLEYESFLQKEFQFNGRRSLSFDLEIEISNIGSAPAENVESKFHFPYGFEVIETSDFENEELPSPPSPPYKPKNAFDFGSVFNPISHLSVDIPAIGTIKSRFGPSIKKTNSYDVRYPGVNIKHNDSEKLDQLTVIFPSLNSIKNFKIEYELLVDNLPDKILGLLNVSFIK